MELAVDLEQPRKSGDVENALHQWTRVTKHEEALFVAKLSLTGDDRRKAGCVDE